MYELVDINSYERRDTFHFYKDFEDPFFNVTANMDVTDLVQKSKSSDLNFFAASMYSSLHAVNSMDAFRLRLVDNELRLYNVIHGGTTVLHENNTFSFCYFDFLEEKSSFMEGMLKAIELEKQNDKMDAASDRFDLIHYSALPWISFTHIKHARKIPVKDSIPKLVFGKYFELNDRVLMPFSVAVHHALVDGWHISEYFKLFQEKLNSW